MVEMNLCDGGGDDDLLSATGRDSSEFGFKERRGRSGITLGL